MRVRFPSPAPISTSTRKINAFGTSKSQAKMKVRIKVRITTPKQPPRYLGSAVFERFRLLRNQACCENGFAVARGGRSLRRKSSEPTLYLPLTFVHALWRTFLNNTLLKSQLLCSAPL